MNFDDTPEEATFRRDLRAWLVENGKPLPKARDEEERRRLLMDWHQRLYKAGWMGLSWPLEFGGRGLPMIYDAILNDEVGAAGAPKVPPVGYLGRAIQWYGTEEQARRWLPGLLSGDEMWCQGFSEPNAGSDLASLCTRAERDGDDYVVNGQKIWTGGAQYADWCLCLVRTNPDRPKHKGISCLVVHLRGMQGVEPRVITKITGDDDFAELFLTDVRVPVANRIGDEGAGWSLAMTTLAYERGPADIGNVSTYKRILKTLDAERAAGRLRPLPDLDVRLARAHIDVEVLRLHVLRSLSARAGGAAPGPEGSVDKLLMTRVEQALLHTGMVASGARAVVGDDPQMVWDYFWSRAASIYGGTEQVQRGIIANRVLGLPK